MDNIFGIGLPEFVLILVIAGMVMGPERIAQSARALGRLTARIQRISRTFFRQLNAELDSLDETGELRSTVDELDLLRRQVTDLKKEVLTLASGATADGKQALREIKSEAQNSIMPPDILGEMASRSKEQGAGYGATNQQPNLSPLNRPETGGNTNGKSLPQPAPLTLPNRINIPEDPAE
jgi:Sec-independent protein translocase protein TatA